MLVASEVKSVDGWVVCSIRVVDDDDDDVENESVIPGQWCFSFSSCTKEDKATRVFYPEIP
jgi:hypothetical protein